MYLNIWDDDDSDGDDNGDNNKNELPSLLFFLNFEGNIGISTFYYLLLSGNTCFMSVAKIGFLISLYL